MRLYFVRHGESDANVLHIFSNRGWVHGLTESGRAQVRARADQLAGAGIVGIHTSPLRRAVESAAILRERLGVSFEVTEALQEYDCGVIEGRGDEAAARIFSEVLDDWILRGEWDRRIEGGESFSEMRDRFVPFIKSIVERAGHDPGNVALIGHGGIFRCMLPLVLDNVDFDFAMVHRIGNASAIVAELIGDRLVCIDWDGVAPDPSPPTQRL